MKACSDFRAKPTEKLAKVVPAAKMFFMFCILIASTQAADLAVNGESDPSAEDVLAIVAETYGNCSSYIDSGTATLTTTYKNGRESKTRCKFKTSYIRGKKFRFAYRLNVFDLGYGGPVVLIHDDQATKVKLEGKDEFEVQESLGAAVARLTGVSVGTAHTVPSLLMPKEIGGRKILSLRDITPLKTEKVAQKSCYKIEGSIHGSKIVMWIDKSTYLLAKIEEHRCSNGKNYSEVVVFSPSANLEIADKFFEEQVAGEWSDLEKQ